MSDNPEEESLDVRQMVTIFLNSAIFVKIPLLFFGFRMSDDPTPFNIGAFALCIAYSIFSMLWFIFRKKK